MKLFLSFGATLLLSVVAAHAQLIPITVTGFTLDVIWGGGTDTATHDVQGGTTGFQYDNQTYATAHPGFGTTSLPDSGTVTTTTATFQFQPYTSNNTLLVRGANQALTLSTPASYQSVGFLLNNITFSANQVQSFQFNFSDSTSDTVTTVAVIPYWVTGNPSTNTSTQLAKVGLQDNPLVTTNGTKRDGTQVQFDEYDFVLSAADQSKVLTSITFIGAGSTNVLDVYAVSGLLAVPEPSTWALLFAGAGGLMFVLRRRVRA